MHNFLVCACKSPDFAQSQNNFVRSHDRETVTFRNSGSRLIIYIQFIVFCGENRWNFDNFPCVSLVDFQSIGPLGQCFHRVDMSV